MTQTAYKKITSLQPLAATHRWCITHWSLLGLTLGLALLCATKAQAHPVIYKGGWVVWSELRSSASTHRLSYTFHPRWALELSSSYQRPFDTPRLEARHHQLGLNMLLKRWYLKDSQANVYVGASAGMASESETHRVQGTPRADLEKGYYEILPNRAFYRFTNYAPAWSVFVESDWESRRWYTAFKLGVQFVHWPENSLPAWPNSFVSLSQAPAARGLASQNPAARVPATQSLQKSSIASLGSGDDYDVRTAQSLQKYSTTSAATVTSATSYSTSTAPTTKAATGRGKKTVFEKLSPLWSPRVRYRLGFAPYVGGMNELQTWFVVQLDAKLPYTYRNNVQGGLLPGRFQSPASSVMGWQDVLEVTPLLRFFYRNALWEVGASEKGNLFASLMLHY